MGQSATVNGLKVGQLGSVRLEFGVSMIFGVQRNLVMDRGSTLIRVSPCHLALQLHF
jgi:hypothetical protein